MKPRVGSAIAVPRLLGHRDYRMTLRYTAITPETVGDEYHKALAQLATKYRLSAPPTSDTSATPQELFNHLAHWLRKHAQSRRPLRALLKRLERLQAAIENLSAPTKK